ncbi:hypothetical protein EDD29_6614 [Actinocorallia herbida]|uniref:HTH cro/C1-type domain-containing protein n=1 Tax=Actinocorallia herbida TaxID=58109 RepID=A0A3N1D640_9ACTN|nr:helix-turn-helix transcriptional regulator [Actinocorallia herbida]ROO88929.1 hypothetical protein EDD29_6614 [Actinocorallia herbida]
MSVRESIDPNSSLWSWLAFDLWFYRDRRGLSLAQTALPLHVTRATVSNWEAGRLRPADKHMRRLDEVWKTGGHFERLHMFACNGHDPDWAKQYVKYEEWAEDVRAYHGKNVPLLVQTENYGRSMLLAAGHGREVEGLVEARMKRQEILGRADAPRLWVIFDEEVLKCPIGGAEVMREQCEHLLAVSESPQVSVRVVRTSAGWHPGHDGPIQLLKVRGREVAYAGAQTGGRLIEAGAEAETVAVLFDQIAALAESRDASRQLIDAVRRTYT